jgi:hypothetical protein
MIYAAIFALTLGFSKKTANCHLIGVPLIGRNVYHFHSGLPIFQNKLCKYGSITGDRVLALNMESQLR